MSIPYAKHCFRDDTDRNFIMDKLFKACELNDEEVVEIGLRCFGELVTQEYQIMD